MPAERQEGAKRILAEPTERVRRDPGASASADHRVAADGPRQAKAQVVLEPTTSGSMRGSWGLDMAGLVRHRQTKGAGTDRPDLPSGYQALLYPVTLQVLEFAETREHFFIPCRGR